jgi:hypothetical protein
MRHHAVQSPAGRHRVTCIVAESLKPWTHLPHQAACAGAGGLSEAREQTGDNLIGKELKYQLRLTLSDPFAKGARDHPDDPSIAPLTQVLQRHEAALKCQYDAFADYVREAEAEGVERYPLYAWTKKRFG